MCAFCSRELFFYSFNSASQTWICIQITWRSCEMWINSVVLSKVWDPTFLTSSWWCQSVDYILEARMRISDIFQDLLSLSLSVTVGIYADAVLKERTVYVKRKVNLCVKIAHALTKLRAISALGRHRQGWLHGHVTCAVSQGPLLRRAHTCFMLCCHSVEILIKLWTRGTSFPFHTGPHTLSSWVQIRSYGAWDRVKSPPAERNKKYFQKEETYELCLKKEQDWKREMWWSHGRGRNLGKGVGAVKGMKMREGGMASSLVWLEHQMLSAWEALNKFLLNARLLNECSREQWSVLPTYERETVIALYWTVASTVLLKVQKWRFKVH